MQNTQDWLRLELYRDMMRGIENQTLYSYMKDVVDKDFAFGIETFSKKGDINLVQDWTIAMLGEIGEVANVVKKLKRDGWEEKLIKDLGIEIVDVIIYAIELALCAGIDLDKCWDEKQKILYERFEKKYGEPNKSFALMNLEDD